MKDFTAEQKKRLASCKYYKGEDDCPFKGGNRSSLWSYERAWVIVGTPEVYRDEYTHAGLALFEIDDGMPIDYKALLFDRFARTYQSLADAVESFKSFYRRFYIS